MLHRKGKKKLNDWAEENKGGGRGKLACLERQNMSGRKEELKMLGGGGETKMLSSADFSPPFSPMGATGLVRHIYGKGQQRLAAGGGRGGGGSR